MLRSFGLVVLTTFGLALNATAQNPFVESDGINAMATEQVTLKPSRLRLVMWVEAQGADAKAAITALNAHKTRVQTELEGMKADAASIRFTGTSLSKGGDENQQQRMMYMQRQMAQQMGQEVMDMPSVQVASATLTAEWELPIQEGDALALLPATLQEQISKRDFAGKKNTAELAAEDQEKLEELTTMMEEQYGGYYDGSEQSSPTIYFVAKVPPDELKKAVAKAFTGAAAKASVLSEAAGVKLGKLKSLSTTSSNDMMSYMGGYGTGRSFPTELVQSNDETVVSTSSDNLRLNVSVVATYAIE